MSLYDIAVLLGYSVAIAAVIGLVRFRKVEPAYQPFFMVLSLGLLNHSASILFNATLRSNAVNANIYVLLESLLYLQLFKNWGAFRKNKIMFILLAAISIMTWVIDNFIWHDIQTTNSFFRIVSSFLLIFLSIGQFNELIFAAKKNLLLNARFLICTGIIIYFSYKATMEVFFLIRLKASNDFYINIFFILIFVNLFVNLIFAWASLCVPKKQKFTSLR